MKKALLVILALHSITYSLLAQCDFTFSLGNDTTLCEGDSLLLLAQTPNSLYYDWQDGSSSSSYMVSEEGIYYCEVMEYGDNLIENGDFEMGDTLFTSDYSYGTGGTWGILSFAGTYAISTDPINTHTNFSSCGDHSSGNGNMMVVNGSELANAIIWSQTLDVQPNTNYQFSTWLMSVVSENPAQLQFAINGINFGATFSPGPVTCNWQQFAEVWNSGSNSLAIISIVNQNTAESGNDFAIDDVIFYELCSYTDSIQVNYVANPVFDLGSDTIICDQDVLILDATTANASYIWQDGSNNPTYSVSEAGSYWSQVRVGNCTSEDSISIESMDCTVSLLLPNVFTPNGDGVNDYFTPLKSLGVRSLSIDIYNRWGKIVFTTSDPNIHWDGKDMSDGTYFWSVSYEGFDGLNYKENGYVSLLR
jgi:gliding motility-associated-like protein